MWPFKNLKFIMRVSTAQRLVALEKVNNSELIESFLAQLNIRSLYELILNQYIEDGVADLGNKEFDDIKLQLKKPEEIQIEVMSLALKKILEQVYYYLLEENLDLSEEDAKVVTKKFTEAFSDD